MLVSVVATIPPGVEGIEPCRDLRLRLLKSNPPFVRHKIIVVVDVVVELVMNVVVACGSNVKYCNVEVANPSTC